MSQLSKLRGMTAVAAISTALAGCGTTVAATDVAGTSDGSGLGAPTARPGEAQLGAAPLSSAVHSGPASLASSTTALDGSAPRASAAATGVQRSRAALTSAPGVTATTITFGAKYSTDTGEANAALGAGNLDPGDARAYYKALVKDVNATGGVAGRKLVPSFFEVRATSTETAESVDQSACEKWSRDDQVFAIFDGNSDILRACAEKAGIVNLTSGASNSVASTFRRYPHYIEVSSITLDRASRATVEGLAKTDYYGAKPVIGVVAWDDPNYVSAVEQSLKPALRRLGLAAARTSYVKVAHSDSDLADSGAGVSNAILRFRDAGVTHVMIIDGPAGGFSGTGLTLLFVKAAGSQRYYPRYGLNDSNSPEAGRQSGLWTADDMRGARVVTWGNGLDESDSGTTPNARRKQCLALMRREGITIDNANARAAALKACDWVWFLRTALGTSAASVSGSGFMSAVDRLGTTYKSPLVYGTRFTAMRRDGVGELRLMKLDDKCGCFAYTSGRYKAP